MGNHYSFYILDAHLGLLNGRSCEEEAWYVQRTLQENGFIIFKTPVYVSEGSCICFELRNCIPEHVKKVLIYDGIFYKEECSSEIVKL